MTMLGHVNDTKRNTSSIPGVTFHAAAHSLNDLPPVLVPATTHAMALTLEWGARRGLDADQLLGKTALKVEQLDAPETSVTREDELNVFRQAVRLSGDYGYGVEVGRAMHVSCFGLPGYLLLVARDAREALLCLQRFPAIMAFHYDTKIEFSKEGASIKLSGYGYDSDLLPVTTEMQFATIMTMLRDLIGPGAKPDAVHFQHAKNSHAQMTKEHFGCEIEYAKDEAALFLSNELLNSRCALANRVSFESISAKCSEMEKDWTERSFANIVSKVRTLIASDLKRYMTVSRVADFFSLTERTLRRKLDMQSSSFQTILDEVRQDKALQLLSTGENLSEISFLLGYSDQTSFRHAFKRWTGACPRDFRKTLN